MDNLPEKDELVPDADHVADYVSDHLEELVEDYIQGDLGWNELGSWLASCKQRALREYIKACFIEDETSEEYQVFLKWATERVQNEQG